MSWQDNVRRVTPYVPGEQPKVEGRIIKLNTNECPYPPTPKVKEAIEKLNIDKFRLYPDTTAAPLTEAIAKRYGLDADEVFVGVGSDDVLSMIFLTFFGSDKPILFPDITYSFYDVWADVYRIPYEVQPLDDNFRIVKEDYYKENGGIVIANPNAPTGISAAEDVSFIEDIVKANPDSVVVVDEAYVDFGGVSALELIHKYDNVIVVQTFSKSRAGAGLRIGYAMGCKKLIKFLSDVKFSVNSYTMNMMAIEYGTAVINDEEYFQEITKKIINTRKWAFEQLVKLGFNCFESSTNFIFCSHKDKKAKDIFEYLKTEGIYVRYFNKPRIDNYLRITIGTDEEMKILIDELEKYLA